MVLYSRTAWPEGDNIVAEKVLQIKIMQAFMSTNDALAESGIDLEIDVVYLAEVNTRVEQATRHVVVVLSRCRSQLTLFFSVRLSFLIGDLASKSRNAQSAGVCARFFRVSSHDDRERRDGSLQPGVQGACERRVVQKFSCIA